MDTARIVQLLGFLVFVQVIRICCGAAIGGQYEATEHRMHPTFHFKAETSRHKRAMPMLNFESAKPEEERNDYWHSVAQNILHKQLESKSHLNTNYAKNIIMFLGDGMSIPTITAGRVYMGGEEQQFTFEQFPYIGLSKTYCANTQVADSACTATAYLGGIKANYATVGVSAAVELNDCIGQNTSAFHVASIVDAAQRRGMATGFITTTSVTHASPAGVYAHAANRNWENDAEVRANNGDPDICTDIAQQLIHGRVGRQLDVILGGGRVHFLPNRTKDFDDVEWGKRMDRRDLIKEWREMHESEQGHYVKTKEELLRLPLRAQRVLGLFAANHMPFHLDADAELTPSLAEMVNAAIDILERRGGDKGYFLFVEGGRIDHAHHDTLAKKALDETVEFDKAIALAAARTNVADTLTIVTADHSHTMSVSGYSSRKNDIFGINNSQLGSDLLPYATLSYANGPGFTNNMLLMKDRGVAKRKNLHELNMKHKNYRFPSTVPLESETHGGDDVAVFASGPFAHLFTGVFEQNFIPHAMGYAGCLGHGKTVCADFDYQVQ